MKKRVLLMILDGWGNGKQYPGNAISLANKPNFDKLILSYPNCELKTSGEDVGLPNGQMGNSEVGHMNIGAGRIVYQQLVRINKSFREKEINKNPVLVDAINYAKSNHKIIHLIGLLSDGGVHSSLDHLLGLCSILHENNISNFVVHAFTDGRDTDPKSGIDFIKILSDQLQKTNGKLASVVGRYYAMDRDKRWERIKLAYELLVNGIGEKSRDIFETIKNKYEQNETDEFLKPISICDENNLPVAKIKEGDIIINFNFRTDRGRELTIALTQQDFPEQQMHKLNLNYITLTTYDATFKNVKVLFEDIDLKNTFGELMEKNNLKQVRIAETEKYPHVTFFFSGGRETVFNGETRQMCPSPKVATYDLQPEMSAEDVCLAVMSELKKNEADFICVNFANPDMVGHTGIIPAEIKAIEKVDSCVGRIIPEALAKNYSILITADHGNGEFMINEDGTPNTAHTLNVVPCILLEPKKENKIRDGRLSDLAPTMLALMGIPQPTEMTGENLLR